MTIKERLDKHDQEIASIRKFVLQGMRMIAKVEELQAATRKDLRELAAAQKRTEASLDRLIHTLDRHRNGGKP